MNGWSERFEEITTTVQTLENTVQRLESDVQELKQQKLSIQRQFGRWRGGVAFLALVGLALMPRVGTAQSDLASRVTALETHAAEMDTKLANFALDLSSRINGLIGRVAPLEQKLAHVQVDPADDRQLMIVGANLHIVNGLNSTETSNGLGNLVIGYNEPRSTYISPPNDISDSRVGSHNLILGKGNNFTGYGGLVLGTTNQVDGFWNAAIGGHHNRAYGGYCTILGGHSNLVDSPQCVLVGATGIGTSGDHSYMPANQVRVSNPKPGGVEAQYVANTIP